MSKIGELYRTKAEDDRKSLQAAAFGHVAQNIRSFADAVANIERVAEENDISHSKVSPLLFCRDFLSLKREREVFSGARDL